MELDVNQIMNMLVGGAAVYGGIRAEINFLKRGQVRLVKAVSLLRTRTLKLERGVKHG
ncbi:hypothetical protein JYT97_03830 [Haliea sp. AH-315-K21]|nr:hypothetical protein [Haliea sp. AH-315-K21]